MLSSGVSLTLADTLGVVSVAVRTETGVRPVVVDTPLALPAHIRALLALVDVILTLTSGPA